MTVPLPECLPQPCALPPIEHATYQVKSNKLNIIRCKIDTASDLLMVTMVAWRNEILSVVGVTSQTKSNNKWKKIKLIRFYVIITSRVDIDRVSWRRVPKDESTSHQSCNRIIIAIIIFVAVDILSVFFLVCRTDNRSWQLSDNSVWKCGWR